MNSPKLFLSFALAFIAAALPARAENWNTQQGIVKGAITGVYGPLVHLVGSKTALLLPLNSLDDDGLDRVAQYLASQPPADKWSASKAPAAKALRGNLQILQDGKLVAYEPKDRIEPEFLVLYFSAEWCAPCRVSTPKLVESYKSLQRRDTASQIEFIFISSDRNRAEQAAYVKKAGMPWPVLSYNAGVSLLERWKGKGIPCVAVVNRNGDLLFHSYEGDTYKGPIQPLADLYALLRSMDERRRDYFDGRHRLAMRQHLKACKTGTAPATVYFTSVDKKKFQGLGPTSLELTCIVDEKGRVASYTCDPELPPTNAEHLSKDVGRWLFLPAVENQQFRTGEATVTINLTSSTPAPAKHAP